MDSFIKHSALIFKDFMDWLPSNTLALSLFILSILLTVSLVTVLASSVSPLLGIIVLLGLGFGIPVVSYVIHRRFDL